MTSLNNPFVSKDALNSLKRCKVFIFDLDGTVYEETSHFAVFERELAHLLPAHARPEFLATARNVLSGKHFLYFGDGYHAESKSIVKDGSYFTWTGEALSNGPHEAHGIHFADDPWGIYGVVARHFGLSQRAIQSAFLATRRHMQSCDFVMTPMPGLADAIKHLLRKGVHLVLITNSPEPDSMAILNKLGLSFAFEQKIFNAKKQVNATSNFQQLHHYYQVPYEHMVSIGDHYRNEIAPAVRLGMKTICIDRYLAVDRPGVTVQLSHPNQIATVLHTVIAH
ncbi:HAD family hydrolase [Alicyclobacillus sp. SO9]|uniref:HAD family hydrolase n=1 Tax=Alicyclobacillus sp. SO9 TaxID=2665646 RepID=UPI0018E70D3E|nr:HAD family hydrolase [Alicyclobacillus sp. SO9]